jgi:hypothetical protein
MEQNQAGPPNLTFEHPTRENNVNENPLNVHSTFVFQSFSKLKQSVWDEVK